MADSVTVTNWPQAGSHEAIAFELWKYLRDTKGDADQQLEFFVKCRAAAYGRPPSG